MIPARCPRCGDVGPQRLVAELVDPSPSEGTVVCGCCGHAFGVEFAEVLPEQLLPPVLPLEARARLIARLTDPEVPAFAGAVPVRCEVCGLHLTWVVVPVVARCAEHAADAPAGVRTIRPHR